MKNWIIGIVVLVLIIIGIVSMNGKKETGPIRVGASLPLSGEIASYGDFTKSGIELAVKEINEAGGIKGRMVEVVYEDDKCSKDGNVVFNKLVNLDKVDAIIGPICSSSAGPGIPIAQSGKTPTIIWASAPNLTKTGDYIFRTYPSDTFQGKYAGEFAYNKLGKRNVAIVYVKNDWGQGLKDTFTKTFTSLGGKIVYEEGVAQETTDLRTILTKVKATNPDMIYFPVYTAGAVAGLKQMKTLGMNITIMGGDGFDAPEVTSLKEANGVLFTYGKFNNSDEFKAKIKSVLGKETNSFTPVAYDSIKILASVFEKVGTDKMKVRDELAKLSYTKGISLPKIEFDSDRDLSSAQVEIRVIKNGKAEVYNQ